MRKGIDIWEELYRRAAEQYHPQELSTFVYANHVACDFGAAYACVVGRIPI